MAYAQTSYRPDIPQRESSPEERRNITKWMAGFAAFFALTLALLTLQMFQATSESTAHTSLVRATAALAELNLLLDHHYDELRTQAEAASADDVLALEDYPIVVELSRDDVLNSTRDELRIIILDRSADELYADGADVLRELSDGTSGTGRFSASGVAKTALDFQMERTHQRIGIVMLVLFVIALLLCGATALACRGWGRLGALGVLLASSSATVLAAGLIAYGYAEATTSQDAVRAAFLENTTDLAIIPIRNGLAGLMAGLAIVAIAIASNALARGQASSAEQPIGVQGTRV